MLKMIINKLWVNWGIRDAYFVEMMLIIIEFIINVIIALNTTVLIVSNYKAYTNAGYVNDNWSRKNNENRESFMQTPKNTWIIVT